MDEGGKSALFAGVLRLVPYSGVQFVDIQLSQASATDLRAWFTEELIEHEGANHRVLLPLEYRTADQTTHDPQTPVALPRIVHPISGRTIDADQVLTLDGTQALRHFAGRWIPIPYLRFIGRDAEQRPRYDNGPTNWVRAFIEPFEAGAAVRVVLAFDTSLEPQSRLDSEIYAAPNSDDAAFGSIFMCARSVEDLGMVIGEQWLDDWLVGAGSTHGDAAASGARSNFQHVHVANYLTLLHVLGQTRVMPEARFVDVIQRRFPVRTSAVDMVLDIGDSETTALLVDVEPHAHTLPGQGFAVPLQVRDLSSPTTVTVGAIPTAAEFSHVPFGDAMLSRDSGRHDAFNWPSLVRIGHEARRLALRDNGTEGVTGLSNLRSFLLDGNASPGLWRQSTDSGSSAENGPMVSGLPLSLISENGAILGGVLDGAQKALTNGDARPAIRPRFSRASILSFFTSELMLHAIAQLNSAAASSQASPENELRELRMIVVLAPPTFSERERDALRDRVEAGVALAWRGLAWDRRQGAPTRPKVVLGIGGELGAQIAFLHDEVRTKYQGRFGDFLRVYRGGREADADTLRVASVDFAARSTSLTIVDYASSKDASAVEEWLPNIVASERLPAGMDAVLQTVVLARVLPAIERRLEECGLNPARHFLEEITGRSMSGLLIDDPYFTRRFNRKVLWPAARGLLVLDDQAAPSAFDGACSVPLAKLVELGGGNLDAAQLIFDGAALQAGARGFELATVNVRLDRGGLTRLASQETERMLAQLGKAIADRSCDLLLLGGEGMQFRSLRDACLAALPMPSSRMIDLGSHPNSTVTAALGHGALLSSATVMPAIAAALERRHALIESGFGGQALGLLGAPRDDGGQLTASTLPALVAPSQSPFISAIPVAAGRGD